MSRVITKRRLPPVPKEPVVRQAVCEKKKFETAEQAKSFNKGMDPWFCKDCNAWHLTSGWDGRITKVKMNGQIGANELVKRKTRRRPPKWKVN